MLNIGLTGNVAAGKSTVVGWFREWGATVIDSDQLVRDLQRPGTEVHRALVERFGDRIVRDDGSLDRGSLRKIVFADEDALAALNAIVHPGVKRRRDELLAAAEGRGDLLVVSDIPLLFEVLEPDAFDRIVLVDADPDLRRRRLIEHRKISADDAGRLVRSQLPSESKRDRSHHVLDNNGTLEQLKREAQGVFAELRSQSARDAAGEAERLLAVFAHPDDESFGAGGTLARYADAGVEVILICATAGEAARLAPGERSELARLRKDELAAAVEVLGVHLVELLDLPDGGLETELPVLTRRVEEALERFRPDGVVTFGPDGITGHADHVAVHRAAVGALDRSSHQCGLFYLTYPEEVVAPLPYDVRGRPDPEISVVLDIRLWKDRKIRAIRAHQSQAFPFHLDAPETQPLFEREWFHAPMSTSRMHDLFAPAGVA